MQVHRKFTYVTHAWFTTNRNKYNCTRNIQVRKSTQLIMHLRTIHPFHNSRPNRIIKIYQYHHASWKLDLTVAILLCRFGLKLLQLRLLNSAISRLIMAAAWGSTYMCVSSSLYRMNLSDSGMDSFSVTMNSAMGASLAKKAKKKEDGLDQTMQELVWISSSSYYDDDWWKRTSSSKTKETDKKRMFFLFKKIYDACTEELRLVN